MRNEERSPGALDRDVAQALKAAGVVWVAVGDAAPRVVWHLWHDGCVWTVVGGVEQQLPGLPARSTSSGEDPARSGAAAEVTVRGPQRQGLPPFAVVVSVVAPDDPLWDEVVPLLHAKRLNAVDGDDQPARWARESLVLRLQPV